MGDAFAVPEAPAGVMVRLDSAELAELTDHAEALGVPVSTALKRLALTAVRTTRSSGTTAAQLVAGLVAALGRDFPSWKDGPRRRVGEAVMRWLLTRCALLPLPAPAGNGVWRVRLDDASWITVTASPDNKVVVGGELVFSTREVRVVAAAMLAATGHNDQQNGTPEGGDQTQTPS